MGDVQTTSADPIPASINKVRTEKVLDLGHDVRAVRTHYTPVAEPEPVMFQDLPLLVRDIAQEHIADGLSEVDAAQAALTRMSEFVQNGGGNLPAAIEDAEKALAAFGELRRPKPKGSAEVNGLLISHPWPGQPGVRCARQVYLAGRLHTHEDGPRWTLIDANRNRFGVEELVHCSTCGWGGYIRDGRFIPQDEWDGDHVVAPGTVFHESWEGEIPDYALPVAVARDEARAAAQHQWETTDHAARQADVERRMSELASEKSIAEQRIREFERTGKLPPTPGL